MDTSASPPSIEPRYSSREIQAFREANEKAKLGLRELVVSRQAFLLVGAGSSKRQGFPLWVEFLTDFYDDLEAEEKTAVQQRFAHQPTPIAPGQLQPVAQLIANDPLLFASAVEEISALRHRNAFRQYLEKTFGKQTSPSSEHRALLELPFRAILTTNYDLVLEQNLDVAFGPLQEGSSYQRCMDLKPNRGNLFRFLFPQSCDPQSRIILHLHGTFLSPQHCVITQQDYEQAYPSEFPKDPLNKDSAGFPLWFLNSIAGMQRIVFLGFSYEDPFIKRIIRRCCENLWLDGKPMHYLISGMSEETIGEKLNQARQLIGHGIQLVCFEEEKGSFSSFTTAIEFLGGKTSQPIEEVPAPLSPTIPVTAARAFADLDNS